ncbi:MAG: efflux RND transporter periplasmic adaptor subunit [Candidatus Hydrogenedentes bacterium]|nr:efflux RND transporter periplasmic adaptor subunit [Candidatus Hydrogenedentota bacterium]
MKALLSFALCAAIIAGGAGTVYTVYVLNPTPVPEEKPDLAAPVNVHVLTLRPTLVEDVLPLTGRIEPWEDITVSAEVSGTVEAQGVEEGDEVRAGQDVFHIDTSWYQAEHTRAVAQETLAKQEMARVESLRQNGISSPQELDRAQTERKVAEATVAAAATRLDKSVVHAPIGGIVDEVFVKAGEWADAGKPLARIVQTGRVKVIVGVPERDIPYFKTGNEVTLTCDAFAEAVFAGRIYRIATTAERETRTFLVEVAIDNGDGRLKPGMIARVRLVRGTYPDAVSVPVFSVISLENQRFAIVEERGVAHYRPIEVGVLQGDHAHVRRGLQAGDRLIVVGHRDLREGQPVTVTEEVAE